MVLGPDVFREVRPDQWDTVDTLLRAAFGTRAEADLVRRLRDDGDMWSEIAAPWADHDIAGYAALSRMRSPAGWACLAPVAVWPALQNGATAKDPSQRHSYAIGTRTVGAIATIVRNYGGEILNGRQIPSTVVVLGKPSFYQRVGFSLERARKLQSPYPIEYTMITRPGTDIPEETLLYPTAFDALAE